MTSNEIGTDIIFKKQLGLNLEIDQKYVGLKMKENNILSFNFRVPGKCDFKGISPVLKNKDEMDQYFLSATLQEDKQYDPLEEEKCETCSGCGFH